MERIKLKVYGITYSQVQTGAYALVLSQEDGPYRIPIVIGVAEAQSIAVRLESIKPSRPMSHDLFVMLSHGFGIVLDEVFINKFEDGIFYSELKFSNDDRQITIDSRTSDAIALALRTGAPIYTTQEILDETGFILEEENAGDNLNIKDEDATEVHSPKIENYSVVELEKLMQKYASDEAYEKAAEIKNIIIEKQKDQNGSN